MQEPELQHLLVESRLIETQYSHYFDWIIVNDDLSVRIYIEPSPFMLYWNSHTNITVQKAHIMWRVLLWLILSEFLLCCYRWHLTCWRKWHVVQRMRHSGFQHPGLQISHSDYTQLLINEIFICSILYSCHSFYITPLLICCTVDKKIIIIITFELRRPAGAQHRSNISHAVRTSTLYCVRV